MSNTRILVCAHRESLVPTTDPYMPIHVGKALTDKDLGYTPDNTGDNISEKNASLNETTAIYWAWKNLPQEVQYVGLCHYRRYFWFGAPFHYKEMIEVVNSQQQFDQMIEQTPKDMGKFLGKKDILLVNREVFQCPVELFVNLTVGLAENLAIIEQIIIKQHPEYAASIARYWQHGNKQSRLTMFVTRRELFDQYSEWLFPILFEVEKHVRITPFKSNARMVGYVSELLVYLWCRHNQLKIKYLPTIFYDPNASPALHKMYQGSGLFKGLIRRWRAELSFFIGYGSLRGRNRYKANQFIVDYLKNQEGIEIL